MLSVELYFEKQTNFPTKKNSGITILIFKKLLIFRFQIQVN
jgi:hypothetical protein